MCFWFPRCPWAKSINRSYCVWDGSRKWGGGGCLVSWGIYQATFVIDHLFFFLPLRCFSSFAVRNKREIIWFCVWKAKLVGVFCFNLAFSWIDSAHVTCLAALLLADSVCFVFTFAGEQCGLCEHHSGGGRAVPAGSPKRRWSFYPGSEEEGWSVFRSDV